METFSTLLALCAGNSPVTRALIFSLIRAWINGRIYSRKAGDLRRHRAHCDVNVMRRETSYHSYWIPSSYLIFLTQCEAIDVNADYSSRLHIKCFLNIYGQNCMHSVYSAMTVTDKSTHVNVTASATLAHQLMQGWMIAILVNVLMITLIIFTGTYHLGD